MGEETKSVETALVIVDMQNDLVDQSSPVHIPGAAKTVPDLQRLLAWARERGWAVFHVVRSYDPSGVDVERPRVAGFSKQNYLVPNTRGADIIDELAPLPGEFRIVKKRFSAFMFTELDLLLRRLGVRRLIVAGTQYPNCIRATCYDALALDYEVFVVKEATSAASEDVALANIRDLENVGVCCISFEALKAG